MTCSTNHYKTLDRIENLKLKVKLYKKGLDAAIDEFDVKWGESISKDLRTANYSSQRRSKSRKNDHLVLCSKFNDGNLMERLTQQVQNMTFHDKIYELSYEKHTQQIQNRLVTPIADLYEDSYFNEMDANTIGFPNLGNKNRWENLSYKTLDILASFSKNENGIDLDNLLCQIKYYGDGYFTATPGFSFTKIHKLKYNEEEYTYTIDCISEKLSAKDEEKEKLIFTEFLNLQNKAKEEQLKQIGFDCLPESFNYRYTLFGEIISGNNFDSNTIYCKFSFDIPNVWKVDPQSNTWLRTGYSQSSSCLFDENDDMSSFWGLPIEMSLISTVPTEQIPTLYIKVMSSDNSNRQSIQGYCCCNLPKEPGSYELELPTWRPLIPYNSKLKSMFLGGSPELQVLEYWKLEENEVHNHYGFQTESSGSSKNFSNLIRRGEGMINVEDKEKPSTRMTYMSDALQRAKNRIKELRATVEDPDKIEKSSSATSLESNLNENVIE
ncbi:ciliary basal body-associated, B9 protein-domain-containing protein [Globomyces pollinis-pini]|nr:ciliary basal body-associated, B9 protein-domain-containing protein [Globomyces pollinis-pini]